MESYIRRIINRYITKPEKFVDDLTKKAMDQIEKAPPVRKIRNGQIITAIIGVTGFALVIDGIGKIFYFLPGWFTVVLGILFLAISGALLKFLGKDANWW